MQPHERPTLEELSRDPEAKGLECPRCGCRDWRVVKTKPGDGIISRRRECRHCGYRKSTVES